MQAFISISIFSFLVAVVAVARVPPRLHLRPAGRGEAVRQIQQTARGPGQDHEGKAVGRLLPDGVPRGTRHPRKRHGVLRQQACDKTEEFTKNLNRDEFSSSKKNVQKFRKVQDGSQAKLRIVVLCPTTYIMCIVQRQ